MTFGCAAYGSTTIGGTTASQWFTFFSYLERAVGDYEAVAELDGSATLFSLFAAHASDAIQVNYEAFTHNDPDETPQSQGTFGGFGLNFQNVIGAARFIRLRASVPDSSQLFGVRGRLGD